MRLIDADALMQNIPSEEIIAKMAVAYAPTIEMPQWIPCSERLPSESDMYLCSVNNSYRAVIVMNFYRDRVDHWEFMNFLPAKNSYVIAWMPLPEAYKERSE